MISYYCDHCRTPEDYANNTKPCWFHALIPHGTIWHRVVAEIEHYSTRFAYLLGVTTGLLAGLLLCVAVVNALQDGKVCFDGSHDWRQPITLHWQDDKSTTDATCRVKL